MADWEAGRDIQPLEAGRAADRRERPASRAARRALDITIAAAGLGVMAPVLVATAIAIRWQMGRPILFRHTRAGRHGEPFELVKFRSMRPLRAGETAPDADGARITPLGRLLRTTSIDELPSLVNVLRGDMAVVGPRPLPVRYIDRYTDRESRRLDVRPGITGWAQIHGRNAVDWEDRLELDAWYVDHRSLALDLRILVRTIPVVVRRSGIAGTDHATMAQLPADRDNVITVLLSSAGRRVELLRGFRHALQDLGLDGRVLATDHSWYSSARHSADAGYDVPACDDPAFVPRLVELCAEERVDLLVPTIDPELPVLAAARDELTEAGTTVAISAPAVVAIAADKVATHEWLTTNGFPTVHQAAPSAAIADAWRFPLVVKPRFGSAARGVRVVGDPAELEVAARGGEFVVQSLAAGDEYTIDALVDRSGTCVCAVPRRRLEVRAGEVAKAVTVRSPALERLAVEMCAALPGPFGALTIQVFVDEAGDQTAIIEVNARFGGGFPLSRQAGADFPRWMLEDLVGLPSTASADAWDDGIVMLRYDAAVFVRDAARAEQ